MAAHSLVVAAEVNRRLPDPLTTFSALMHDCAECVIGDIPKGAKSHVRGLDEKGLMRDMMDSLLPSTRGSYPLSWSMVWDAVDVVDKLAGDLEFRALTGFGADAYTDQLGATPSTIEWETLPNDPQAVEMCRHMESLFGAQPRHVAQQFLWRGRRLLEEIAAA